MDDKTLDFLKIYRTGAYKYRPYRLYELLP